MVLTAWCSSEAALQSHHEYALLQVSTISLPPPPTGLSHNCEEQLHTSPDHYLLVVPPLQICSLCRKNGTNHTSYIHMSQGGTRPDLTVDVIRTYNNHIHQTRNTAGSVSNLELRVSLSP